MGAAATGIWQESEAAVCPTLGARAGQARREDRTRSRVSGRPQTPARRASEAGGVAATFAAARQLLALAVCARNAILPRVRPAVSSSSRKSHAFRVNRPSGCSTPLHVCSVLSTVTWGSLIHLVGYQRCLDQRTGMDHSTLLPPWPFRVVQSSRQEACFLLRDTSRRGVWLWSRYFSLALAASSR